MRDVINATETHVKQLFLSEETGHDWFHIDRVRINALKIAKDEVKNHKVDLEIVELAALLHDIADSKKHGGDHSIGPRLAREWLTKQGLEFDKIDHICHIIEKQSFSAKAGKLPTIEGQIVQDADRLEAIGAVGIARCFAYGGSKGRPLYDPHPENHEHSIQHFYDKLLKVKDLMNTETGKILAKKRHTFLEEYLDQFFQETERR